MRLCAIRIVKLLAIVNSHFLASVCRPQLLTALLIPRVVATHCRSFRCICRGGWELLFSLWFGLGAKLSRGIFGRRLLDQIALTESKPRLFGFVICRMLGSEIGAGTSWKLRARPETTR